MKLNFPIFCFLFCFCFKCIAQNNDPYYWYFKEKIYLKEDSTKGLLIKKNGLITTDDALKTLMNDPQIVESQTTPYNAVKIELKSSLTDKSAYLKNKFPNYTFCKGYKYNNTSVLVLNQIIIKPKASIEKIKDKFGGAISELKIFNSDNYLFEVIEGNNTLQLSTQIMESGLVEWCQPNFLEEKSFSNTYYPSQYNLDNTGQFGGTAGIDINAPEAWSMSQGCNVRVAVVDDGVENHVDLDGRVAFGFDPVHTANPGNYIGIGEGHGMNVAGVIAATNNTIGIRGIAANSIIVPVKISANGVFYSDADIASAIYWAWHDGNASIMNLSWGGSLSLPVVTSAIGVARTQGRGNLGTIVVAASGNGGNIAVATPANIDGVITVGAVDKNGNITGYSQRGPEMDLVAPSSTSSDAGDIFTLDREGSNGRYFNEYMPTFGQTSATAPQVSGVAALMLSVNPNLTEAQVRTILQQTATDMGPSGFDNTYGFGRVNAQAALIRVFGGPIIGPDVICTSGTFTLTTPAPGSITWSSSNPSVLSIDPSTGVVTKVGTSTGYCTISASVSSSCGSTVFQKTVWAGSPSLNSMTYGTTGTSFSNPVLSVNNVNATPFYYSLRTNTGGTTTTWNITPSITGYSNGASEYIFTLSTGQNADFVINTSNACGSASKTTRFRATLSSFSVFPNPASDIITIEFDDLSHIEKVELFSKTSTNPVKMVRIKDSVGKNWLRDGNKLEISVKDLLRGQYFLHVTEKDGASEKIQIILN